MNNPRSPHLHSTPSTIVQQQTEEEVAPFFIDLSSLNEGNLDHLRSVGLLPPLPLERVEVLNDDDDENDDGGLVPDGNNNDEACNAANISNEEAVHNDDDINFDPYAIRLLREAHITYLSRALSEPLSKGFVSLDASHPWMIYWCLHSLDLLDYFSDEHSHDSSSSISNGLFMDVEVLQKGILLNRIVSTLEACWTDVDVELSKEDVLNDTRLRLLYQRQREHQQSGASPTTNDCKINTDQQSPQDTNSKQNITLKAGGFGGGPSQMPHCAPTYAAVLSLSIIASFVSPPSHPYHKASSAALQLLSQIRLKLYAFFVSLRVDAEEMYGVEECTAFRMQHDGEVDVRAGYCLLAPCYLLGLLNDDTYNFESDQVQNSANQQPINGTKNLLTAPSIARHIASCQTFEGGFGAEPHNEAHGGYTFCALAALRILNSVQWIDVNSLHGWLVRRQLGYEGGFCGRTNKLVDGCYSFWQGGAMAVLDGWLLEQKQQSSDKATDVGGGPKCILDELTFDEVLLQRYILLCAQEVNGGLRDKPSKQRDFYHSCYNLSGLSVAQHRLYLTWPCQVEKLAGTSNGLNELFGDKCFNIIGRTDPVINIRVERVQFMLDQKFDD